MPTTTASIDAPATPNVPTTPVSETGTPVEKVSQDEMLKNFQDRLKNILNENKQISDKLKENEIIALKLQGAIEALTYYNPQEETVDNVTTEE
tara:strand:+ start:5502 stop:5780 length:279 start_codon:yes stop_codon:yes gene_type:complete